MSAAVAAVTLDVEVWNEKGNWAGLESGREAAAVGA